MNLDKKKPARREPADSLAVAVAAGYECPDCQASTALTHDAGGIWHLIVSHDDTCPSYRKAVR